MGLDIDIVKFKKADFDRHCDAYRTLDFLKRGPLDRCELQYYRRHYIIRDILAGVTNGWSQCDYHELTEDLLRRALVIGKEKLADADETDARHLRVMLLDIENILKTTDFENEVITLSWISYRIKHA